MAKRKYVSPLPADAHCARCDFTGTREAWRAHRCRVSMARVEQDDDSAFARFWRELQPDTRGRISQGVVRRASVVVGWMEPPRPMPERVKDELRERNQQRRRGI